MASKNLNLSLGKIGSQLSAAGQKVTRYSTLIFIVLLLGMYSFLMFRINALNGSEPTDEAVAERLQSTKRPKIDQSAVDKIEQLQDNSVEVQTLFDEARENPFHE